MSTSSIPQLIESCGFCRADEVEALQTMKTGMTNRSYAFFVKGNRYIIRIPGEGTDRLINRAQEHAVYSAIEPLGISETVHYFDPATGIKIASYLTDAHVCNSVNWVEVEKCVATLREFHSNKLRTALICGNAWVFMRVFGRVPLPFTRIMIERNERSSV